MGLASGGANIWGQSLGFVVPPLSSRLGFSLSRSLKATGSSPWALLLLPEGNLGI